MSKKKKKKKMKLITTEAEAWRYINRQKEKRRSR